MKRMLLIVPMICGIALGTYTAHAGIIYARSEIPTPPTATSPATIQLRGKVLSINTTYRIIELLVVDPYNPSAQMRTYAGYSATTTVRTAAGVSGFAGAGLISRETFPSGTNVFISVFRQPGPLLINRISAPTYL